MNILPLAVLRVGVNVDFKVPKGQQYLVHCAPGTVQRPFKRRFVGNKTGGDVAGK